MSGRVTQHAGTCSLCTEPIAVRECVVILADEIRHVECELREQAERRAEVATWAPGLTRAQRTALRGQS